jgi:DNA-binding MarR family transcriptional regulator
VSLDTTSRDERIGQILQAIDSNESVSQRALARELGIALGLTNLLIRGLVSRGFVRVSKIRRDRIRYLLTPTGVAEKARMSRVALVRAVDRYSVARRRLRAAFQSLSSNWSHPVVRGQKRVVFWGSGEVAEIGYICLHEAELTLVAVVDDQGRRDFFGVPLHCEGAFGPGFLDSVEAPVVIVMSMRESQRLVLEIARSGVDSNRVMWP